MSFENSFSSLFSSAASGPCTLTVSTSMRIGREPAPVGSYKPRSPIKSNDWKLTTPRGSAWVHETKNSDWSANGYAVNKFNSQRKYYWHSYHREWKYKTNHSDALKSDAYRQHTLQIKSDEQGRTPLPEEIKTLY